MKILVVGGTGLTGRLVTNKLEKLGHKVVIGSPSQGVNILTSEGLQEALTGTEIVIDLSNSSSPEGENALRFFETAGKNLVKAELNASVKHHIVLSIVGTDDALEIGYLRAKKLQEDTINQLEGKKTIILTVDEVLFVPTRKNHFAKNIGKVRASELATYIVKKDKPLLVCKR